MNTIPGYLTAEECTALREIFEKYNYQGAVGVEIGSLHGRSSVEIAQAIPLGTLYCIDGWDGYDSSSDKFTPEQQRAHCYPTAGTMCTLEFFKQNVGNFKNILTIKGRSPSCVKNWKQPVDFVFLDALHENPSDWDNIEFWLPKIKSGGRFCGHDFYPERTQWPDVHDNVRRLEAQLGKQVTNPKNTSVWYFEL